MSGSFRQLYQEAFQTNGDQPSMLHFAAHSHHPWPDATLDGQIQYWRDSNRLLDKKWEHFATTIFPKTRARIAEAVGITKSEQIVIAPNTHEFVARLFSCLDLQKKISILTTDSEFHSFSRQLKRYDELENVEITRVPVEPFATFQKRFTKAISEHSYDLVFFSHVFFNSGYVVKDLDEIVRASVPETTTIVIDGYHSFFALPIRLSPDVQERAFFLAGGYKYAQSGEGLCWMYVPPDCQLRPLNTGWFAEFDELETSKVTGDVKYAEGGARFAGATFDPSGCYRFNSVCDLYEREDLTIESVHQYVLQLRSEFIEHWLKQKPFGLTPAAIINREEESHFVTFLTPDANTIYKELAKLNIRTDVRADRLRFGFGLYQDQAMIDEVFKRMRSFT